MASNLTYIAYEYKTSKEQSVMCLASGKQDYVGFFFLKSAYAISAVWNDFMVLVLLPILFIEFMKL